MGRGWSGSTVYDLTDPAVAGRIPFGVTDHVARAHLDGEVGDRQAPVDLQQSKDLAVYGIHTPDSSTTTPLYGKT